MFTPFHSINGVILRQRSLQMLSATTIAATVLALISVGCGGGGSSTTTASPTPTPTPSKSPTPTPTPSPTPTPTAKQRAIAANFIPNYAPSTPTATVPYLHWTSNKNITVFIRPAVHNIQDNTPSNKISATTIKSYVDQAIADWTGTTDSDFTFQYVTKASDADIEVVFVEQLLHSNNSVDTSGLVGLTFQNWVNPVDNLHGVLTKATAQVLMSTDPTLGDSAHIEDVTTHELGHSIGIIVHSTTDTDLMFAKSMPPSTITQRDQNTIFFLYYSNTALGKAQPIPVNGTLPVHHGEIE